MIFATLFVVYGFEYVEFGNNQRSVMMRANLAITYISVPVAGAVWFVFAGYRLFQNIATYRSGRTAT